MIAIPLGREWQTRHLLAHLERDDAKSAKRQLTPRQAVKEQMAWARKASAVRLRLRLRWIAWLRTEHPLVATHVAAVRAVLRSKRRQSEHWYLTGAEPVRPGMAPRALPYPRRTR